MTFLKKLGQILLNVAGVATGIGPLISPFLGGGKVAAAVSTGVNDLTQIAQLVVSIETAFAAVPGSNGAQKLQALVPLVANIISTSQAVAGKQVQNTELFMKGCTEVAQGMVDVLNAIHPDEAKHAT
ncbi:MAG TPA: hypothetical protein VE133_04620 [Candidatus Sulfotelmatobacter sp.]|nr:hypothetical protein [Candidatus Sulfotelmatobacter sp.]